MFVGEIIPDNGAGDTMMMFNDPYGNRFGQLKLKNEPVRYKEGTGIAPVTFFRDEKLPFLEVKMCHATELAYHKHFHEEYSIGFINKGVTNAWCDGTKLRVEAGRVISFPPQMMHACHPDTHIEWKYKMLYIKPEWLQELEKRELDQLCIPYLPGKEKSEVCGVLMNRTIDSLKGIKNPIETETSLIELIQTVVSKESSDLWHERSGKQDQKYVKLIKEYLHAHFMEQITLKELEEVAGISKFHLIRLFKKGNHLPLHAYQNLLRINHAKLELAKKRPIVDIAAELGFYDQSHFTRMFAKIVGATPGKYVASL